MVESAFRAADRLQVSTAPVGLRPTARVSRRDVRSRARAQGTTTTALQRNASRPSQARARLWRLFGTREEDPSPPFTLTHRIREKLPGDHTFFSTLIHQAFSSQQQRRQPASPPTHPKAW